MATGVSGMSFNLPKTATFGKMSNEVSQDLHLKMSKKIAQLTKVIYALNTKNDEHESIVSALKEQHEDEMQKFISETKSKIESYRNRIEEDTKQMKLIEILEQKIKEHEQEKLSAKEAFEKYRETMECKAIEMKTVHSEKMLNLSTDVLNVKKEFESKLDSLIEAKRLIEEEKSKEIEKLKDSYEDKIEKLKLGLTNIDSDKEKYENQLMELRDACKNLESQNKEINQQHLVTLNKMKENYEMEINELKTTNESLTEDKIKELQEDYDKLLSVHENMNKDNLDRIKELLEKLNAAEGNAKCHKENFEKLQNSLKDKDDSSASLNEQLSSIQKELSSTISINKQLEGEIKAINDRCEKQSSELKEKSAKIGKLEGGKLQVESQLKDKVGELSKLKDKLKWLEDERKSLEKKGQSQMTEQTRQLKSLEKSLENLSTEKRTLQEKYDRDIAALKQKIDDKEYSVTKKWKNKIDETEAKYVTEIEEHRKLAEQSYAKLKNDLESRLKNEKESLTNSTNILETELEKIKEDYQKKLQNSQREILRLENALKERDENLGGATNNLESLHNKCSNLEDELEESRDQLRNLTTQYSCTKTEFENLKRTHERSLREFEEKSKKDLNKLSNDLDEKWMIRLRNEKEKLRSEMQKNSEEDKRAALAELKRLKDDEISKNQTAFDKRLTEMNEEILRLKSSLSSTSEETEKEIYRIKAEAEEEMNNLRKEMIDSAQEYQEKIEKMIKIHSDELKSLEEKSLIQLKDIKIELKKKHQEDMEVQLVAHKSTVDILKENFEKVKEKCLDELRQKNAEKIATLRSEMEANHTQDIEDRDRLHEQQMMAARLELDRALEISRQKEAEFTMKLSELESDGNAKIQLIKELQREVDRLERGINDVASELEQKGQEILRIRSEMLQSSKMREDQLNKRYERVIQEMKDDQKKDIDIMLEDFNTAQNILKEKIDSLTLLLEEAEERYENRESKDEDIQEIARLKEMITDREDAMKKLIDDRKYYQLELVNREKNFNKVFSSSPNVGVINPLVKKNSGKGDASRRGPKLDPIPHPAILHSDNLSRRVPLPPPSNKP